MRGAVSARARRRYGLRCSLALSTGSALALFASAAAGRESVDSAIREPVRLTAGASSDFMGMATPGRGGLYFVSDASGTLDLMLQHPIDAGPRRVSSGLGDIAWPRVSPDGKSIAYISFERDVGGDVCVRSISGAEPGAETCIADEGAAQLQVLWWDDAQLAVVSRPSVHSDFVLRRVEIDGGGGSSLLARNMVGAALSPDRAWLAYVPVERSAEQVGVTFSNRTARGLRLQRLGGSAEPLTYVPGLPGVTGYLAFDGRGEYLYFSQFLNDTNRDGVINGDDHGVIFRVPFATGQKSPLAAGVEPQQLTSARWDCHYPEPGADRLIVTCGHEGSLDVYSLPLEGSVPQSWGDARLRAEIEVARDLWTQLLLSARRLSIATSEAARRTALREIASLHLQLGEHESTIYYAEEALGPGYRPRPAPLTWANLIGQLARHRREDLALIRGQLSRRYIRGERARLAHIAALSPEAPADVQALALLVVSEIQDDIGEKADSLATFRRLDIASLRDPLIVPLVAGRAERLYRLRGDRAALLDVYRLLSQSEALDTWHRLPWAQRFVTELGRGRSKAARGAALAQVRAEAGEGTELALLLDLERILLNLEQASEEGVRAKVFELYKRTKGVARRRAIVFATLQAAARQGSEYLKYQFSTSWASWLDEEHAERKYAESLYEQIVLDRAYGEEAAGNISEARGYFYGTTVSTDSLEAHIGFIEARLAESTGGGTKPLEEVYARRFEREPDSPVRHFVDAYLLARALPTEPDDERHDEQVGRIVELLRQVDRARPREPQVHQLWGFALHQRALRSRSRPAAVSANRQYLLALDLARQDDRLRASLLSRLGVLQAALGNHGPALSYLMEREQLPQTRPVAELGLRVAIARSAWHTGAAEIASQQMARAQELLDRHPELSRFRPIVLDWLALSQAGAGDAEAAWKSYSALVAWQQGNSEASARNRLKARIGLASTALQQGEPGLALDSAQHARQILDAGSLEAPARAFQEALSGDYRYTRLDYDTLLSGLEAVAYRAQGDTSASIPPLERRIELLREQVRARQLDEDRLDLAQAYRQLAEARLRGGDLAGAQRALENGLAVSRVYDQNTGTPVSDPELAMVRAYAELFLSGQRPRESFAYPVARELERVLAFLSKYRNPRLTRQRIVLEIYLTMLELDEAHGTAAGNGDEE